jgi:hypothetical protein
MQNNPYNPYDDVFNNLAKIVEEIVKNIPDNQHARIVGYTIITRHPSDDDMDIPYEVVESEDMIYITAMMPAEPKTAPLVDIQPDSVHVGIDNRDITIMLNHPIDRIHSYYRVHRSVMDISLKKVQQY